jgi:hypothetical protein
MKIFRQTDRGFNTRYPVLSTCRALLACMPKFTGIAVKTGGLYKNPIFPYKIDESFHVSFAPIPVSNSR